MSQQGEKYLVVLILHSGALQKKRVHQDDVIKSQSQAR